ncbi:EcsC family protein [Sulfoacidibacillus thermotolerans]|uniref:EcsC family protein n=1 Tax=Sulfoacidibacillus thermotolerans TaxID=1765684 RepID=A0A2U3D9J2_SULT2|nr:EcsC family protein [Sulfoacidibacillus thermotolerans]PWI57941.1 hypothetical protein BM613_05890 [Sulfoacidibacillus thermotolerans]
MTPYEEQVLASWSVTAEPPFTVQFTQRLTQQTGRLLHFVSAVTKRMQPKLAERITDFARGAIYTALEQASTARQFERVEVILRDFGSHASTPTDIRMLPLDVKDATAERLFRTTRRTFTAQGAAAGLLTSALGLVPGLQGLIAPAIVADLYVTLRLMAQCTVETGYSYGYTLHTPEDLPHLLVAMAPITADTDLILAKMSAHLALREAGFTFVKSVGEHISLRTVALSFPAVGQLVDLIATRLAIGLLEQQGTLLLPIAGAAVQGSIHAAFAQASYLQASRYFQRQHLIERYGEEEITRREEQVYTNSAKKEEAKQFYSVMTSANEN